MPASLPVALAAATALAVLTVAAVVHPPAAAEPPAAAPFDFKGRYLVSVSDADMVPSAYVDGKLGAAEGADALSVIRLDRPARDWKAVETPASNSVTGPPMSVAVTPDGRYAIAIETRGPRPADKADAKLTDLSPGGTVAVVDLTDPDKPTTVQKIAGPARPLSVSVNAKGTLVAVAYAPDGAGKETPLGFYRFADGKLSGYATPKVPGWKAGDSYSVAEFHPKEDALALLDSIRPQLTFVRQAGTGVGLELSAWGNPVAVEKAPFLVRFAPDGRHALVNASYADEDTVAAGAPRGTVSSVRLTDKADDRHRVVSRANVGVVPEGLAVSPDGRWVATANLENSYYALDDPRQGNFASLSLLRLDQATGFLERCGDFSFDGRLPETVLFDNSSRYLAATTFSRYDRKPGGSVDFWRIAGDAFDPKRVELVRTGYSVPVRRGVHTLVIAR